jgi:hypothetical protein
MKQTLEDLQVNYDHCWTWCYGVGIDVKERVNMINVGHGVMVLALMSKRDNMVLSLRQNVGMSLMSKGVNMVLTNPCIVKILCMNW